jgi:hypothetical protein
MPVLAPAVDATDALPGTNGRGSQSLECDDSCHDSGVWAAREPFLDPAVPEGVGRLIAVARRPGRPDRYTIDFGSRILTVTSGRALPHGIPDFQGWVFRSQNDTFENGLATAQPVLVEGGVLDIAAGTWTDVALWINWWQGKEYVSVSIPERVGEPPEAWVEGTLLEARGDRIVVRVGADRAEINVYPGAPGSYMIESGGKTAINFLQAVIGAPDYDPNLLRGGDRVLIAAMPDDPTTVAINPGSRQHMPTGMACQFPDGDSCEWLAWKIFVPPDSRRTDPGPTDPVTFAYSRSLGVDSFSSRVFGRVVAFRDGYMEILAGDRIIRCATSGDDQPEFANSLVDVTSLAPIRDSTLAACSVNRVIPSDGGSSVTTSSRTLKLAPDRSLSLPQFEQRSANGESWQAPVDVLGLSLTIDGNSVMPADGTVQLYAASTYLEAIPWGSSLAQTSTLRLRRGDTLPHWSVRVIRRPDAGSVKLPILASVVFDEAELATTQVEVDLAAGIRSTAARAGSRPSGVAAVAFGLLQGADGLAVENNSGYMTFTVNPAGLATGMYNFGFTQFDKDIDLKISGPSVGVGTAGVTYLFNRPSVEWDEHWWRAGLWAGQMAATAIAAAATAETGGLATGVIQIARKVCDRICDLPDVAIRFDLQDRDPLSRLPAGFGIGLTVDATMGVSAGPQSVIDGPLIDLAGGLFVKRSLPCHTVSAGVLTALALADGTVCIAQLSPEALAASLGKASDEPAMRVLIPGGRDFLAAWLTTKDPANAVLYLKGLKIGGLH